MGQKAKGHQLERRCHTSFLLMINSSCIFLEPDLPHLVNEERILLVTHVGFYHLLFTGLADELFPDGNPRCPFFPADDATLMDIFHGLTPTLFLNLPTIIPYYNPFHSQTFVFCPKVR